jgi:hypothetical protein
MMSPRVPLVSESGQPAGRHGDARMIQLTRTGSEPKLRLAAKSVKGRHDSIGTLSQPL